MPHCQRIHIDQKDLISLKLQILGVIIPVEHMVVLGNSAHESYKFLCGLRRQIVTQILGPADRDLPHVR